MHASDAQRRRATALAGLTLLYAAVAVVFAAHARPTIDEGIFLWAGRLVAEGQLPYRDFPFSQAPMLPYALAAAPSWSGSALLGGRAIACAASVLGMAAALWLAQRVAGLFAAVVTLLVTLATLPLLAVATTVRSQALGTPLLVLGVAALALPRRSVWSWSLAPSLMLWSSGMRLTNFPVFAAVSVWTAWQLRAQPARLLRVAGLVAAQALVIGLPILSAPGAAYFHLVAAQATRDERLVYVDRAPPPPLDLLGSRIGDYLGQAQNASALLALTALLAVGWAWRARAWRPDPAAPMGDPATAQLCLAALGALAFAPHLALGAFHEYLIPLWTLLAPAVGIGVATELGRWRQSRVIRGAVAAALLGIAGANAARSVDVWIGSGRESFASFRRVAEELGKLGGPRCTMLTFETELAVEAGCSVVPGLEYSFFSYFADLPTEEARRLGVANLAAASRARPRLAARADRARAGPRGPAAGAQPGIRPRRASAVSEAAPARFPGPARATLRAVSPRLDSDERQEPARRGRRSGARLPGEGGVVGCRPGRPRTR